MTEVAGPAPYRARDWEAQPPNDHAAYKSTALRVPRHEMQKIAHTLSETTGPIFKAADVSAEESDLTRNAGTGEGAIGERIIVAGRVLDENGDAVSNALVEIWQANAAGRYRQANDQHRAPLDPNFVGAGRCVSSGDGEYEFLTVRPGAYPWANHDNAWRPPHIHFSVVGPSLASRLVTQMYFPGDPLLELDPIFLGVPESARNRLIAAFDLEISEAEWALGYRFDIVLRGRDATPRDL
ncbi:MAG: protocatechuate 3,4-dioxygenase subunit beta [Pseudomonadales bacterium]